MVLYLLVNLAYVYALDPAEMMRKSVQEVDKVAVLATDRLFGPEGAFEADLTSLRLTGPCERWNPRSDSMSRSARPSA